MGKIVSSGNTRYPYMVQGEIAVRLAAFARHRETITVTSKFGQVYAVLQGAWLTLYDGYAFDGCSCAPDFKRALPGCCVHDALYQMLRNTPEAFPREWADEAMLEVQQADKFRLARIYFWAVALFGSMFLGGCAAVDQTPPAVMHTLDIYVEDQGFFVITERGSDESMAVRFNVAEVHPCESPETNLNQ